MRWYELEMDKRLLCIISIHSGATTIWPSRSMSSKATEYTRPLHTWERIQAPVTAAYFIPSLETGYYHISLGMLLFMRTEQTIHQDPAERQATKNGNPKQHAPVHLLTALNLKIARASSRHPLLHSASSNCPANDQLY